MNIGTWASRNKILYATCAFYESNNYIVRAQYVRVLTRIYYSRTVIMYNVAVSEILAKLERRTPLPYQLALSIRVNVKPTTLDEATKDA